MTNGAVTLGDLNRRGIRMLEVACSKCERCGRRRLDRLIAKHGAGLGLPALRGILAHDCPKMIDPLAFDQCGVHFPQLAEGSAAPK